MTLFGHGLVVGRFLPPHAGHHRLIDEAWTRCRRLTVFVVTDECDRLSSAVRRCALEEMHPAARIVVGELPSTRASSGDAASSAVASLVREQVRDPVDVWFTAETGDDALAATIGAARVVIARQPAAAPVDSAAVRRDPKSHWHLLSPAVRGDLALRVVVTGSESTGKTTLAKRLAERYATVWVPEFGRQLTVVKQQRTVPPEPWQAADFSWIAAEQERLTNEAARRRGPLVVADTDAVATQVWEERYFERASHATERIASASRADLYLLALHDVPWIADGVRDGDQELRRWMTGRIRALIAPRGVPIVELGGSWEERDRLAIAACDDLLERGWRLSRLADRPRPVLPRV